MGVSKTLGTWLCLCLCWCRDLWCCYCRRSAFRIVYLVTKVFHSRFYTISYDFIRFHTISFDFIRFHTILYLIHIFSDFHPILSSNRTYVASLSKLSFFFLIFENSRPKLSQMFLKELSLSKKAYRMYCWQDTCGSMWVFGPVFPTSAPATFLDRNHVLLK